MALDLVQYENKARKAIRGFWQCRDDAARSRPPGKAIKVSAPA